MFITLTTDDMLSGLNGPEKAALQTAALASGQSDPLVETLSQVTQEVRGYVAACARNQLGEGATIPSELKADALAIARWRAANRLNVRSILSSSREKEYDNANAKLRDVAACRFAIEQPATATDQVIAGPASEVISSTCKKYGGELRPLMQPWRAVIRTRDHDRPRCRVDAMAAGIRALGGEPVFTDISSAENVRFAVAWGCSYVDAAWRGHWRGLGVPVLIMELGYIQRCAGSNDPSRYSQLGLGRIGWLPPYVTTLADRLPALGIDLPLNRSPLTAHRSPKHLLVLGQVPDDAQHQLGPEALGGWLTERAAGYAAQGWQILFRPHPLHSQVTLSLEHRRLSGGSLADCFSIADRVLTYNSTAGIEALLAGLPVDCSPTAHYYGVRPDDTTGLLRYLQRVACAQWTCAELATGEPLRFMNRFAPLLPKDALPQIPDPRPQTLAAEALRS